MSGAIYWFRNDLRIEDNPAFELATQSADVLLPIFIHESKFDLETQWLFPRVASHRKVFLRESLLDLKFQLRRLGSDLIERVGVHIEVIKQLCLEFNIDQVYCEQIIAPEELNQINDLEEIGITVKSIWQSSMLDPQDLPFDWLEMPDIFTQFRQLIEFKKLNFKYPIQTPRLIPPVPNFSKSDTLNYSFQKSESFCKGGSSAAHARMNYYFEHRLVDSYKQTRNQIVGMDFSSKFSPWLSLGCLSPRTIADKLHKYQNEHGQNEGTYWLWFELLWRDYFRFLHFKYGNRLYLSKGLSEEGKYQFDKEKFIQWSTGNTGQSFIDAGMRELNSTGFLSNRMRQIIASYWIYDMKGDWQAGAAWFEAQLIDFDIYSNQGNWLYIAGKGTDPRGGRAFDVVKQSRVYDPDGAYQKMWLT